MSGEIRCDECGCMIPFDEETDAPAVHDCVHDTSEDGLQELDFDSGYIHLEDQ